jgi:hypothetical protein
MPWPFDLSTLLFIALAVYILWRTPLWWSEEVQPEQPKARSPLRMALAVVLWVATFLATLAVITYCQNPR